MNNIAICILVGLIGFIWGFAYCYSYWAERAGTGQPFDIKGKVYKIVELDVVEKRGAND
ncbi:hypothetical protein F939_02293 [Acinetobacter radioresistens DSM 6976 = NBRC 102413 = CIP 103788]|uniref:hypothetical protein n=1 Tax=Acinetobacter radioresistens TaxID=40216 RepID=UPI00028D4641|nr:hypothetical protein [Acinetobacter radioresistens]ENV87509.1 hypothetical protein F939_02293 [Acinetobacter radioresistens DSM 6976 = NBRC 102413 = CIP 103788]BBL21142.1 hypothetical protein ACRAD_18130 [Acinetobacter radioresistens DSM 6976 = NBRC 102413 = CIP 103788]